MYAIKITLEQIGIIISFFTSIMAIIVSLMTYRFHKRELFVKYITAQRVKHIEDYKDNLYNFIEACIHNDYELAKLSSIKLELQFSPVSYLHQDMSVLLNEALKSLQEGRDVESQSILLQKMQQIIKNEWEQMKIESGRKKFKKNAIHDWNRYKKEVQF